MNTGKYLPATTADVLKTSTKLSAVKVFIIVKLAEILGFWATSLKNAAADVEEMTMKDFYYWVYKSKNPVCFSPIDDNIPEDICRDFSIVKLPKNFTKISSVTFGAAGDILRCKGIENSSNLLYENIFDLLFDKDISFANYESPVTNQTLEDEIISDVEPPIECASPAHFDVLKGFKEKNFTVLNTANNHINDKGLKGIKFTHQIFRQNKILPVGTNENIEEYGKGRIFICKGIKIGFVSATFGLNGHNLSDEDNYRVHVSKLSSKNSDPDLSLIKKQIDDCKNQKCDFIIASLHWGQEFEFFPRRSQVDAAHEIIEYGADSIISHHPHVIQPVEFYKTKRDPDRNAVIAYSLGSLVWGYSAPHLALSLILNMTLAKGKKDGIEKTYIETTNITPVFRNVFQKKRKYYMKIDKLSCHLDVNSNQPKLYIKKMLNFVELVINDSFELSNNLVE